MLWIFQDFWRVEITRNQRTPLGMHDVYVDGEFIRHVASDDQLTSFEKRQLRNDEIAFWISNLPLSIIDILEKLRRKDDSTLFDGFDFDALDSFSTPEERYEIIGMVLYELNKFRDKLKGFPIFPSEIFVDSSQGLSMGYSIIKKWTIYYVCKWIANDNGKVIESLDPIQKDDIITSFTEYDLSQLRNVDDTFIGFRDNLISQAYYEYRNVSVFSKK